MLAGQGSRTAALHPYLARVLFIFWEKLLILSKPHILQILCDLEKFPGE